MNKQMRILYLHPAAGFGGASKSLIELFRELHAAGINGDIITPRGSASGAFQDAGMTVIRVPGLSQFDNTQYGHYRGLRWLILLRELWYLPWSVLALWRVRKRSYDVIHANEITLLPLAVIAKAMIRAPLVVHVRSVQFSPNRTLRSRWINGLLARHADAVVAIDHTVARTLDERLSVSIVHNSISMPADAGQEGDVPRRGPLRLGIFGVLIPAKGVRQLIEAVQIVKAQGVEVECWIAGENVRSVSGLKAWLLKLFGFARDVRSELEAPVANYGLEREVKFLGLVKDIRSLYRQIDVLCFPSHLNAAGRPVFEAALFGVPSVVAIRDPLPDAILHEETGLAISEPLPELIADAILRFARDEPFRARLGRQAKAWAGEVFSLERNARAMSAIYSGLVDRHRGGQ
jgi:glycosyltransferase involved in cell wall biosynthesis